MIAVRVAMGAEFPTAEQLARTDVLLIYTADGGDLNAAQREALAALLKRGGGLVTVLDGVCGHDPKWWKTITGAAWEYGKTKWVYTNLTLHFRDADHPVTKGAVDFKLDDEVYDGLHVIPEAHVLAESEFTPKDAAPKSVPQVWRLRRAVTARSLSFPECVTPHLASRLIVPCCSAALRERAGARKLMSFARPTSSPPCAAWPIHKITSGRAVPARSSVEWEMPFVGC